MILLLALLLVANPPTADECATAGKVAAYACAKVSDGTPLTELRQHVCSLTGRLAQSHCEDGGMNIPEDADICSSSEVILTAIIRSSCVIVTKTKSELAICVDWAKRAGADYKAYCVEQNSI